MSWSKIKIFFEKSFAWCVQHWRWLVFGAIALVSYILGRKNSRNLWVKAELARKQYKKEAESIEKAYSKEDKKIEKAEKNFKNSMEKIEKEKLKEMKELEIQKRRSQIKLIKNQEDIDKALKDSGINEV